MSRSWEAYVLDQVEIICKNSTNTSWQLSGLAAKHCFATLHFRASISAYPSKLPRIGFEKQSVLWVLIRVSLVLEIFWLAFTTVTLELLMNSVSQQANLVMMMTLYEWLLCGAAMPCKCYKPARNPGEQWSERPIEDRTLTGVLAIPELQYQASLGKNLRSLPSRRLFCF